MNSATSSATSPLSPEFRTAAEKIGLKKNKLEILTGLIGYRALQNHQRMSERNQEAENRHVRRTLWNDDSEEPTGDDDMGDTILGDVTHPTPVIVSGQSGNLLPVLAALALGLGLPAAGIGGYLLNQVLTERPEPADTQPATDETIGLGLGKIEDYLQQQD